MAQPFDRSAHVPPAGELDRAGGQFWVSNPWQIVAERHNLSAYERNRTFLNIDGSRFADVSFLTATDSDGDGRAALGADLDGDGMQELVVRQAGGGAVLLFRNRFPRQHYLQVALRGTRSNALGVGARLVARVGSRQIVREMYPMNTFASQSPCQVYFGLGHADRVDRLSIHWPSGLVQELTDLAADQSIRVTEGEGSSSIRSARLSAADQARSPASAGSPGAASREPWRFRRGAWVWRVGRLEK